MATKNKESKLRRDIEDKLYDAADNIQVRAENTLDVLIDRLKYERDNLERDLKHEYRNARRYVRANPEQGIGIAFVAGLAIGVLIAGGRKK
ncbi:MAG: DUF883 family protein [Balneolaceae bacterium]|nr:DUF883 family protein [Balneolaceae bacterium]